MSAKDYKICPALFKAYIAKTRKNSNLMTNDRREITEQEIMSLIDWWLDKNWGENHKSLMFESHIREGMNVLLAFRKKEDTTHATKE